MLRAAAPSIFAVEPWQKMSEKYAFIPTIDVVEAMRAEGFQPVMATQARTRIPGKQEFTKHVIRFRDMRAGNTPQLTHLGQIFPELILTNSHDGASAYKLDAGLFRLVCLNGLTVAAGNVSQINVTHRGGNDAAHAVINASFQVVEDFPEVIDSVETFGALQLSAPEQNAFAEAALMLRYDTPEAAAVRAADLLRVRRNADAAPTLWNTFNTVQENIIAPRKGTRGVYDPTTARRKVVRGVNGISEDARINKALWQLTARMAEIRGTTN